MNCKDCVHCDVCEYHEDLYIEIDITGEQEKTIYFSNVENECNHFKNKADFVEVVRCMDCVFWDTESKGLSDEHICKMHSYGVHSRYTIPNDYCSYGESRFRSDVK